MSYFHLLITVTQGISSTVVLVRVEIGISYEHNTKTPNSSNPGRPIQPAPFTSNINRTTIIDIARSDDDARS